MVKVREDYPIQADGQVDLEAWLDRIEGRIDLHDRNALQKACLFAQQADESYVKEHSWSMRTSSYVTGLAMADILADLKLDQESLVAAVLYRAVREEKTTLDIIAKTFGYDISHLIDGVLRMATISQLINPNHHNQRFSQSQSQLDNVRKMLVAMIDDVRIALIKLAERTFAIRELKDANDERQQRVAREIFDVYAPLAHRLGIGQIKWELEDLSFRYLEPDAYKHIARLLDEKRLQRDSYIQNVTKTLKETLANADIQAEVTGRAKHIYSIWRKMQRKKLSFHELYDIRAVRVLVPAVKDCYAALGLVHSLWKHIPKEFDDYVATPKENGYRSLHTAVIGPEGKALEVQIRTSSMHEEAELGVCAHWVYKEGTKGTNKDTGYESKIAWLRQVLEWQEDMGETQIGELADQLSQAIRHERVYVFTRDGHVIDLEAGATPLDFAYSIHTEIGNACRGAKVNGRIVPLSYKLQTSDQVEILTQKGATPSRDWMLLSLGYLGTTRALSKVKQWFKLQDRENNIVAGREILEKELARLALTLKSINLNTYALRLNARTGEDVLAGIGAGDIRPSQVINLIAESIPTVDVEPSPADFIARGRKGQASGVIIEGLDNIMTHIAGCCRPIPGEPITGYITHNRGVSVHSRSCSELLRLHEEEPQRIIDVSWQHTIDAVQAVNIAVKSWDRTGLLRDITNVLANEHVNVTGVNTQSNKQDGTAQMQITVEVKTLEQLGRVLAKIEQQPNVITARRMTTVV